MGLRRAVPLALLLRSVGCVKRRARALAVRGGGRAAPSHTANLNYQEPHPTLATGRYIDREDQGDLVDTVSPQPVEMTDARQLDEPATLERMGFCLEKHPTAVRDFRDDTAVGEVYYEEVRELVKRASGASRVFVFDHTVVTRSRMNLNVAPIRETGVKNLNAAAGGAAAPVPRVHCDYTHEGAPRRLRQLGERGIFSHLKKRDLTADEVDALEAGRYAFINVWRSIDAKNAVARSPLAVCDEASVDPDEKFKYELRFPDRTGETYSLRHSAKHKWYWYPAMSHDECLVFKCFDKRRDSTRFTFHTAFDDPSTTEASPPRQSIEVRTIAFFDEG